jgi:hypothetical protein
MVAGVSGAQHGGMSREQRPFEEALALMGLTGGFVGDDPQRPSHLRLRLADRAIIWPLDEEHGGLMTEMRRAVADMIANAALLSRSGREIEAWAESLELDSRLARTQAAFEMALFLDSFAERLLTRRALDGLLDSTTWRTYLHGSHLPGLLPGPVEDPAR